MSDTQLREFTIHFITSETTNYKDFVTGDDDGYGACTITLMDTYSTILDTFEKCYEETKQHFWTQGFIYDDKWEALQFMSCDDEGERNYWEGQVMNREADFALFLNPETSLDEALAEFEEAWSKHSTPCPCYEETIQQMEAVIHSMNSLSDEQKNELSQNLRKAGK